MNHDSSNFDEIERSDETSYTIQENQTPRCIGS